MNTINATRTSATKFNTKYMVELALMVAVILVMSLTPLGYIRTPGLSITLLTVPVAVGAIILGPVGGLICGLTFGLTSFYQCFVGGAMGTVLLGINPFGTFVTTVVTRTLEGFLTGLIFVVLFVGVQGLIEAGICFIVASVVSRALYAALKLNQN